MNDEPDLELEAASATVDGLATVDERALVEASPSLQAEVERFTALRARLTAITVPSTARESAIAAALAAFDALPEETATIAAATPAANVVSLDARRRRQYGVLLGAAAAVAVLGIGAVALTSRGSDDEATSATMAASTMVASAPAEPAAGSGQTERVEDSAAAEKAEAVESADDVDATAGDAASADLPAPSGDLPLVINAPAEVTPEIGTPQELLAFAMTTLAADPPLSSEAESTSESVDTEAANTEAADTAPAAPATTASTALDPAATCSAPDTEYAGTVVYQDVRAYVVRVIDSGEVRALSTEDCAVLASAVP